MNVDQWGSCLEWLADRLVAAVHGSQDPDEIGRLYQQAATLTGFEGFENRDPGMALAVLLAAWVSPDRPAEARGRWLVEQAWQTAEDAEVHHLQAVSA